MMPALRRRISPTLRRNWEAALDVSEQDVARYVPTKVDVDVGEALLAGQLTIEEVANFAGHTPLAVRRTLTNPVAMAWVSRQIHNLFRHRAGVVDAALYQCAVRGDVNAIKLFYQRMGQLMDEKTVRHVYSGGVRLDTLSEDELRLMIKDKNAALAEFRVIEGHPADDPGRPDGAGAPEATGPDPVLPAHADGPPETAAVPRGGEDPPP